VILLPQIDSIQRSQDSLSLQFVVAPTLEYFEGHFPECALLPGVVQIGWVIRIARAEIPVTGRFRALAAVKFTRVIQPGAAVALDLSCNADRTELAFEYRSGGAVCSSGRVLFH
jgi:3-hydroxymyristoyl/3-hydroxydecanoyl-(acyl carrier protein) dehydratase